MYFKRAGFLLFCVIFISSCINQPKNNFQYNSLYNAPAPAAPMAQTKPYELTETFESGKKSKYTKAGYVVGRKPAKKKAVVTVVEGETIDLYGTV